MRPSALIPAICCAAALTLSFLCLFAGHKKGFMEGYSIITLNTSALGETFLNESRSSNNPVLNYLDKIPNRINSEINDRIGEVTSSLGIDNWYSAHMLDYCFGEYTPTDAPNATIHKHDIHKNVTGCSKSKAMYKFDPTQILQDSLNKTTGKNVTLKDLQWPDDIQHGIHALNALMAAMFILYVIAIAFIAIAFLAALLAVITSGRLSACVNFLIACLAFLAIGLASALSTATMFKAAHIINKYGNKIGIEAYRGGKFLALTWVATALMLLVLLAWVAEFCIGRRHHNRDRVYGKHG